jgi:hypothetical protein
MATEISPALTASAAPLAGTGVAPRRSEQPTPETSPSNSPGSSPSAALPGPPPSARRWRWAEPLALWGVSRLLVAVALVAGSVFHPITVDLRKANPFAGPVDNLSEYFRAYAAEPLKHGKTPMFGVRAGGSDAWLAPFTGWDGIWFQSVVELGYQPDMRRPFQQNIAFFPVYPLLIRGVAAMGVPPLIAGVLISHVATLLAAVALYNLVLARWGRGAARWSAAGWLFYPTALFGSVTYADSLLALAGVLSLAALLGGRYLTCGAWAGLATAIRPPGLALGMALVPSLAGRQPVRVLAAGLLSITGIVAYFGYLYTLTGDPLTYPHIVATWRDGGKSTWNPLVWLLLIVNDTILSLRVVARGGPAYILNSSHLFEPLFAVVALSLLWKVRKLGAGVFLGACVMTALPLSTGALPSFGRYSWANMPLFIALGIALARSPLRWVWILASSLLLLWLAAAHGGGWEVI